MINTLIDFAFYVIQATDGQRFNDIDEMRHTENIVVGIHIT